MNEEAEAALEDEIRHDLTLITALTNDVIGKLRRLNTARAARGLPAIVIEFPKPPESCHE